VIANWLKKVAQNSKDDRRRELFLVANEYRYRMTFDKMTSLRPDRRKLHQSRDEECLSSVV
jgi:hypothetical protein